MSGEPSPVPEWVVMSAGTGGTSATIGRFIRYRNLATRLCVVDVEGSAFFDAWQSGDMTTTARGSRIEGMGRPRVEPSFVPGVIDRMIRIPDAASIAAAPLSKSGPGRRAPSPVAGPPPSLRMPPQSRPASGGWEGGAWSPERVMDCQVMVSAEGA